MKLWSRCGAIVCLLLSIQLLNAQINCVNDTAGVYPCNQINLQGQLTLSELGATGDGNDIWGWTDTTTGKEYALVGLNNGTAFVDVSDPTNPIRLGNLPTNSSNSSWRDIKVVDNYAYIVSEASNHGMQVFDLTRLRNVNNPPVTFTNDGILNFGSIQRAHNIVANEEAGFVYLVGTSSYGNGGITTVDISDPSNPSVISNYGSDGYSHDALCVHYRGPDQEHIGKELCIGLNENEFVVLDMSDKDNIQKISEDSYDNFGYVHQGWLTDDHRYLLINDETDESSTQNTRTHLFDLQDLDNPVYLGFHEHSTPAIDHNLYVKGRYAYLSNYRAGLRIMDLIDIENGNLVEKAYFDVYPANDARAYTGSWSNYPYFKSGNIIISSIDEGLFVVKPSFPHYVLTLNFPSIIQLQPGESKDFKVDYNRYAGFSDTVNLSIPNLPSDLSATLSQDTISKDGLLIITVTAALSATEQNYSLILRGEGDNTGIEEKIAMGVMVSGDPILTCNPSENISGNLTGGTYRAADTLTSNASIDGSANIVFEAGDIIVLKEDFQTEKGAIFTARIASCSSDSETNVPPITKVEVTKEISNISAIKIYPNPFHAQTNIVLNLKEEQAVEIRLYDLAGRLIKTVVPRGVQSAGIHQFQMSGEHLESGFYVLQIGVGEQWESRKLGVVQD
ncbi:MAG: choice-of-anchor B family protein [Bacteroidota bacterium]